MSRQLLRRYMPDPQKIREQPSLKMFGDRLHDPNLWHLNRRSVSMSVFLGVTCAFVPFPIQMVISGMLAIQLRCNLPIAIGLVWISNPFTFAPIFYFAYWVGALLLGYELPGSEVSQAEFYAQLSSIWQPFLLGCLVAGVGLGVLSALIVRTLWRLHVIRRWQLRRRGSAV